MSTKFIVMYIFPLNRVHYFKRGQGLFHQ